MEVWLHSFLPSTAIVVCFRPQSFYPRKISSWFQGIGSFFGGSKSVCRLPRRQKSCLLPGSEQRILERPSPGLMTTGYAVRASLHSCGINFIDSVRKFCSFGDEHTDIKQSHYRLGQAQRVLRKLRFPDFVTTAQDGGRLSALLTGRLYPQEILLVLISVRVWVDPRVIVLSEGFYVNGKSIDTTWDRTSGLPICNTAP